MALGLSGCGGLTGTEGPEGEESPPPEESLDPGFLVEPPKVSQPPEKKETPPPESNTPEVPEGPDVPLQERAEDAFFEDAAFMGNSLMDGFRLFSGLATCDYYAATSMTVAGATSVVGTPLDSGASGTMVDALTQKPYGKIYILLGINEIWMDAENFAELYGEMLDPIIEAQPDCDIYIMGITPVSAAKSSSDANINMTKINQYNESLYQLAKDKGCYFLDLVDALADDTGYLPAGETTDGVHFSADLYKTWVEYVRTHYVTK